MAFSEDGSVLLLGASGYLGSALSVEFGSIAIGTYKENFNEKLRYFDAQTTSLTHLVSALPRRPEVAILLFGETRIDVCARDPVTTASINVAGSIRVINELCELGIMPIFISSDAVFDGRRSWWKESDEPNPILTYGAQKLAVEKHMKTLQTPWVIFRLPKLLYDGRKTNCILTDWIDRLNQSTQISCATDQFFTPAGVGDVAHAIATVVIEQQQGLIHLGGSQRISRRELLDFVIEEYTKFKDVRANVVDCSIRDFDFPESRPLDTSLLSERFGDRYCGNFLKVDSIAKVAVHKCLRV